MKRSLPLACALLLALPLRGLDADLLVVLLQGRKVLARLGELTLLHTLADVPVHERALGVHEVELVVDAGERLGHRGGVGHHAQGALHRRVVQVAQQGAGIVEARGRGWCHGHGV